LDGAFGFGTSDPYCYVDLGNQRFRTATIDKTVNPEWNRTFYFDISDLYECLTLSIYDEDQNEDDFLGRLCLPIADMINDQKIEYRLKTKRLDNFTQGALTITCSRYYNPIRLVLFLDFILSQLNSIYSLFPQKYQTLFE